MAALLMHMLSGCWCWFAGVAFSVNTRILLTEVYLDVYSSVWAWWLYWFTILGLFFFFLWLFRAGSLWCIPAKLKECPRRIECLRQCTSSSRWDRFAQSTQTLWVTGHQWHCALGMYYLNTTFFGIAEDMIHIKPVGLWNALGFTAGQLCVHWLIASILDLKRRSWELDQAETTGSAQGSEGSETKNQVSGCLLNFGEVHSVLTLVNTYSMAAVWLGFTSSVACSEGCNGANNWFWYWILVVLGNAALYAAVNWAACKYEAVQESAPDSGAEGARVEGGRGVGHAVEEQVRLGEVEVECNPIQSDSKQDSEVQDVVVL
eukprot:TRINITY_DN9389_c0_g1_i1.p1 TRINITY_DN9389_c0_g1~~TRINITY_DN9389_c0_g1_i1.p1  ORF type:complete len:318 (-),score=55.38 TRINITY_DN9389_c0_g1_i1:119-1072(-)